MSDADYIKNLPKKRMASGVIFFNEAGEVLIVKPGYKDHWSVPGGVIDKNESPRAAALREVKEEVGLEPKNMQFVCLDYMSPQDSGYSTHDENIQFIFFGGILTSEDAENIQVPNDEISEYRFVSKDEALKMVGNKLSNRLKPCFEAIEKGIPVYLEGGKKMTMIKIKECGEPLVDIKKLCPDLIVALDSRRMKKEKSAYLRKTVAKMLCKAKSYLPKGYTFIIGDAWRPQYVQKEIYNDFVKNFKKKYPKWSKEKIQREVEKYVASYRIGKFSSGHMTGGAIDLRLVKNGRKVPMKSSKLTYQENAKSFQPKLSVHIQRNRKIMFDALAKAGLSNYPKEYWHWSYGDIWWARRNKKKYAIYGAIASLDTKN